MKRKRPNRNYIIYLFIITQIGISQCITGETFNDYIKSVNELEKNKQYDEAIVLTKTVWSQYPDKRFELIKELEYLYRKTNRLEENLLLWEDGHNSGYFFFLNKQMKQFEPYLEFTQFDSLVIVDSILRAEALQKSTSIYEVFLPEDYMKNKKYPLLMILHGGGSNLVKAQERWKIVSKMKTDFIVVFVQSYKHYDSKYFGWRSGDTRSHKDITKIYTELTNKYQIDTSNVIIGGTSAGGTMAFDLAFRNIIPVMGVIGICPGKPKNFEEIKFDKELPIIYMIGGENDFYLSKQKEMVNLFDKLEIQYKHIIIPEMGHEFPKDYEYIMDNALNFLM